MEQDTPQALQKQADLQPESVQQKQMPQASAGHVSEQQVQHNTLQQAQQSKPQQVASQQNAGRRPEQQSPVKQLEQEITSYRIPPLIWGVAFLATGWAAAAVLTAAAGAVLPVVVGAALAVAAVCCLVGVFKSRTKEYAQFSEMGVRRSSEAAQERARGQAVSNEKAIEVKGPEVKVTEAKRPEEMRRPEEKGANWQQKEADRKAVAMVQDGANR